MNRIKTFNFQVSFKERLQAESKMKTKTKINLHTFFEQINISRAERMSFITSFLKVALQVLVHKHHMIFFNYVEDVVCYDWVQRH